MLAILLIMDATVPSLIVKRSFTFFGKMITLISFCFLGFGLKSCMMELSFCSNLSQKNPYFWEILFLRFLIGSSLMFALRRKVFYFLEAIMTLNLYDCYLNLYSCLLLIVLLHLTNQKEYWYLK